MSSFQQGSVQTRPYVDPTPLPDDIPKVQELGVTSGPLKSAAFFIGAYCKEVNGGSLSALISPALAVVRKFGRRGAGILFCFLLDKEESRIGGEFERKTALASG
ncbi:hypothetical protein D9757_010470 [Collybiopsis confluens]|uniref:Uncharacterized protein n=1 Tax=Collybiopsis confluens TaxID=2823264 RepID=A0A8H5LU55_9AGAR|nr:hypothetical protein D9757_010470 [Collybiopsis confluens]